MPETISYPGAQGAESQTAAVQEKLLRTKIQVARIELQVKVMELIGESNWTEQHGRSFSLLFPSHTTPGDRKVRVLDVFEQLKKAPDDATRQEMLRGIVKDMEAAVLKDKLTKHHLKEGKKSQTGAESLHA